MGMSASQARFLSLTARKTNVEYEGQQINQQRTALSNESSNYYSQLTSMTVPTPPVSADFMKVTYSFENGTETNVVTSLIATPQTRETGVYMLNYVQEIPVDTMVTNGTNVVSKILKPGRTDDKNHDSYTYQIGNKYLETTFDGTEAVSNIRQHLINTGINEADVAKMSDSEVVNKVLLEEQYRKLAQERYGQDVWYVRYQKDSTGAYEPIYYNAKELGNADTNEKTTLTLSGMKAYMYGQATETKEIKNAKAKVEQDSSGRYISIVVFANEEDSIGTYYKLTTSTEEDEAAYNDAMNQYFYDKAQYDKQIQEVNAKIEIIQVQDKNLELKLKQLDTEENAIQTEMDAVKKVISKNVESSFKTFNA